MGEFIIPFPTKHQEVPLVPSHGRGLLLLITDVTVQETVLSPRMNAVRL